MSDDGEQERYDLGVLIVHGIGQQAQGQTLTAWADPVIRWLQVWLGRDPVEVGAAELGPVPEDPAAPAQVELRVVAAGRDDGQPATRRWLLAEAWWAEAWWAEAFTLPRFRELAVWGFAVLPWTVVAHFAARLQRAWRGPGIAARVARVLWQSLGLLLAVVLFPLLAVGVLVVVALGAVPIPWVRQLAVALQRLLSTSVGDSFVLVSSPTRGQAIVTRTERDLRWLAARCRWVAVVAHSQGPPSRTGHCAGSRPTSASWPASSPSARARPSWSTWRASATPTPPGRSGWPRPGWWSWPPASGC
jgi:hypothetical protein